MPSVKFETGRDFAQMMTAADPLAPYRDRFYIPKTSAGSDCVYLCGHSLGLQPKSARAYIEQELQDWERFWESRAIFTPGILGCRITKS